MTSGPAGRSRPLDPLRTAVAKVRHERSVVVHGDFHYNNVLGGDDGATTVIDWSNVCIADPRTDLAWLRVVTAAPGIGDYSSDADAAEDLDAFEAVAIAQVVLEVLTTMINSDSDPDAVERAQAGANHTFGAVARLQDLVGAPAASLSELVHFALARPQPISGDADRSP